MIVTVSSYKIILHALQMKTVLKMSRYSGWKISQILTRKYIIEKDNGFL